MRLTNSKVESFEYYLLPSSRKSIFLCNDCTHHEIIKTISGLNNNKSSDIPIRFIHKSTTPILKPSHINISNQIKDAFTHNKFLGLTIDIMVILKWDQISHISTNRIKHEKKHYLSLARQLLEKNWG